MLLQSEPGVLFRFTFMASRLLSNACSPLLESTASLSLKMRHRLTGRASTVIWLVLLVIWHASVFTPAKTSQQLATLAPLRQTHHFLQNGFASFVNLDSAAKTIMSRSV